MRVRLTPWSADARAPGRFEVDYLAPEGAVRGTVLEDVRDRQDERPLTRLGRPRPCAGPAARNGLKRSARILRWYGNEPRWWR